MAIKKEKEASSEAEAKSDTDNESLKEATSESKKFSGLDKITPLLMTLIVAIPSASIIAYINMPQKFDDSSSVSVNEGNAGGMGQPAANWSRYHDPEWVTERRAEMEKRRAEYKKKNMERSSKNNNAANFNSLEPPQWVKDQQAKMEQEQARYQEQMAKQLADMNNRMPGYTSQPGMNMPQNSAMNQNRQAQYWQNQNLANVTPQPPVPHYNGYSHPVNPYYYNGLNY